MSESDGRRPRRRAPGVVSVAPAKPSELFVGLWRWREARVEAGELSARIMAG